MLGTEWLVTRASGAPGTSADSFGVGAILRGLHLPWLLLTVALLPILRASLLGLLCLRCLCRTKAQKGKFRRRTYVLMFSEVSQGLAAGRIMME